MYNVKLIGKIKFSFSDRWANYDDCQLIFMLHFRNINTQFGSLMSFGHSVLLAICKYMMHEKYCLLHGCNQTINVKDLL